MTMVTVVEVLSLLLVSVLWGCTNPFLKRGTEGIENVAHANKVSQLLAEVKFLLLNVKYLVPFLLNQCGCLVYYYTLSTTGSQQQSPRFSDRPAELRDLPLTSTSGLEISWAEVQGLG
ncbi:transmembrane protein 234 isoform 2-T2 [Pholidichthys leucotaenia]